MNPKTIFVCGYPKSGNTWLTRLLARYFEAEVKDRVMDNAWEIASEVNRLIEPKVDFQIAKSHYLPNQLIRESGDNNPIIVYIYRDPRSVCVSAFFYFHRQFEYPNDYKNWNKTTLKVLKNPFRYLKNRTIFTEYVESFFQSGLSHWGSWKDHLQACIKEMERKRGTIIYPVSYEDLLIDPELALMTISTEINITTKLSTNQVKDIIGEETVNNLSKTNIAKDQTVYRKGIHDDWKNYFSKKLLQSEQIKSAVDFYMNFKNQ